MNVKNTIIVIRTVLTLKDHTTAVVIQDLCWKQTVYLVKVNMLLIIKNICKNILHS